MKNANLAYNARCGHRLTRVSGSTSVVTVDPSVAIVTVLALFVLALVALLRAPPEDIAKIIRALTRWFSK